jgi:hypothetical protein
MTPLFDWDDVGIATGKCDSMDGTSTAPMSADVEDPGVNAPTPGCEPAPGCTLEDAYAPPYAWGTWEIAAEHIGSIQYTINSKPIGDGTYLTGQVRWYGTVNGVGQWIEQQFAGSITFQTANAAAQIKVRYYGSATGTAVYYNVCV